jgi:hypothetical protein
MPDSSAAIGCAKAPRRGIDFYRGGLAIAFMSCLRPPERPAPGLQSKKLPLFRGAVHARPRWPTECVEPKGHRKAGTACFERSKFGSQALVSEKGVGLFVFFGREGEDGLSVRLDCENRER